MAQVDNIWGNNFQKDFGNLDYLNQKSWESGLENKAEITKEVNDNSALISQLGSNNQAQII